MSKRKVARNLDEAWEDLGKAIDGLDAEHKIVGRRTSRAAVLAKIKRVRTLLDRDFPAIAKKAKAKRKTRTPEQRLRAHEREMARIGYVRPTKHGPQVVSFAIKAGVKIHISPGNGGGKWVPVWLVRGFDTKSPRLTLAAAKRINKSKAEQKALDAAWRLSADNTKETDF